MLEINLKGRHALITGGSQGIGAEICRVFADCGADVAFTYKNSKIAATSLLKELNDKGGRYIASKADAKDPNAMRKAIQTIVERLGTIDLLVANVGASQDISIAEMSVDEWNNGITTNLSSTYIAIKMTYSYLIKAKRGDILMIGSSAAYDGGGGAAYYSTSKAGLIGLMKYLVREFSPNVRVNTIHPCMVNTKSFRLHQKTDQRIGELKDQIPLRRLSKPNDIANLAAFLCSPLGEFITGQSILVDGGRTLWKRKI